MRLLDAADSAALDAADALDERAAYEGGVLDHLTLTDESVAGSRQCAPRSHADASRNHVVVRRPRHGHDGRRDGRRHVRGTATLPMSGWVLESLGGSVTITVTSRARAPLG